MASAEPQLLPASGQHGEAISDRQKSQGHSHGLEAIAQGVGHQDLEAVGVGLIELGGDAAGLKGLQMTLELLDGRRS